MDDSEPARRLGAPVPGWTPPPRPAREALDGRYVRMEPLDPAAHADDLFRAYRWHDALWDYMPTGPFADAAACRAWAEAASETCDPLFHVFRDLGTGRCGGVASWLRIAPEAGSIEVGWITLSPELQRTRAATEGLFLMMDWAMGAGYRRYEWKCDALNLPSRRAAGRFGFSFEGVFRQATVVKGRNRDTAWYSVVDGDWPGLRAAHERWLSPANFDGAGRQRLRLGDLTRPFVRAPDPAFPAG